MKKYRILFACVFIFIFVSFAGCEFADIVDYMGLYESSSENQSELQETSSVSETTSSEETSIEETETEPCTHSRTQSVTESKRSCTTHGKIKIVCLDCKETIEKIKKDPLGHQYGGWVTVSEVSADTDGVKYRECGRCKEREYETIPAGYSAGLEFISYGDGTCYLASIGSCKSLDIVVPEVSPNGDIVVAVGNNAFYDEEDFWSEEKICNIRSIVLPDSVEVIGNDAFNTCMNLESVKFPKKLKIIGERAFAFCDALSTVVLPDGVVEIGKSAFSGCIKLTSVKLSKNLKTIGEQAFECCYELSYVNIPEGVTYIGRAAFYYCDKIASIHIPASVEWIGDCIVSGKVKRITVDPLNSHYHVETNCLISEDGRIIIGFGNFEIPADATSIGESAFEYSSSISHIVIPSSVTEIADSVFACSSVKSVTLPEGLTQIMDWLFFDCTSLESVTIPKSVEKIGAGAFCEIHNRVNIIYAGTSDEWGNIYIEDWNESLVTAKMTFLGDEFSDES